MSVASTVLLVSLSPLFASLSNPGHRDGWRLAGRRCYRRWGDGWRRWRTTVWGSRPQCIDWRSSFPVITTSISRNLPSDLGRSFLLFLVHVVPLLPPFTVPPIHLPRRVSPAVRGLTQVVRPWLHSLRGSRQAPAIWPQCSTVRVPVRGVDAEP